MNSVRIRFVGGSVHNQLIEVSDLRREYRVPGERRSLFRPAQHESYLLMGFKTEWGTVYYQYVLESLCHRDTDLLSCCTEFFPRHPFKWIGISE